jgi:hypothetical protein
MKRFFMVLSNQKETPTDLNRIDFQYFVLLDERHPTPNQIKDLIRKYRKFAFLYLFKGDFDVLSNTKIQFSKFEFVRKYNCSSYGLTDGPCKD